MEKPEVRTDPHVTSTSRAGCVRDREGGAEEAARGHTRLLDLEGRRDHSGETAGDLFAQTLKLGYFLTTIALFLVLVVTLVVQPGFRRYTPFSCWTVILSTSMAGTTKYHFVNRDASVKYSAGGATSLDWGPQGSPRLPRRGGDPHLDPPGDLPCLEDDVPDPRHRHLQGRGPVLVGHPDVEPAGTIMGEVLSDTPASC
ncbi:hypothetical protein ABZ916_24040 [Streptomyces sp. NPDC046853]|uniref:hypothetical protein n=1 Tax=Streptomyces sp. NPDC046853 TaxID=3154920 RepID=UPI0033DCBDD5